MKISTLQTGVKTALVGCLYVIATGAFAHDGGTNDAGTPVCLEANYMVADAMNAPFSSNPGGGQVIEQNIITGERGITVNNPFATYDPDVCPDGISCGAGSPWKPTGNFSGGMNGHAFITSAAQHALTEFHRDGTPIRSVSYNKVTRTPGLKFGQVPRPLGTQIMPNGNLIQAVCDANFFNASNSDAISPNGKTHKSGNASNLFFPPVYSTAKRAANSRLLVIDQETLQVIDEYSQPAKMIEVEDEDEDENKVKVKNPAHILWGCAAGIIFDSDYMYVSTFHGGAVLKIDWRAGIDKYSRGVGSNKSEDKHKTFKIGKKKNRAKVDGIIDFMGNEHGLGDLYDPNRRDTLRAISFDEQGNVYATNRRRSQACEEGEAGCNPGVFRQRISIADAGNNYETATIALDPGVNVIAGIRINRMSARACDAVQAKGGTQDDCDVETLLVAASAMNPGCLNTGPVGANPCFTPGGYVAEYLIDVAHRDGGSLAGDGSGNCNGDPNDYAGNTGCALPISTFGGLANGDDNIDPRMLMPIQRAFIQ